MFKKTFAAIFLAFTICLSGLILPTFADDPPAAVTIPVGRTGDACQGFLGLTSWDCGIQDVHDESTLKAGIWQIAANIATDIAIIAAYLALGYVIYGGYLYIFSAGDPGKAATGKKTLTQAFIGLAITMSASIIMGTIRYILLGRSNNLTNCVTAECVDPNQLIENTIQWVIAVSGLVAVIFVLYGGISYITSAGDPSKLQKAKQVITYALIGLAIVALAELITAFVTNMIRNAAPNEPTSYVRLNIKEPHSNES
ncbi:hypothetical protein IKG60_01665 [Candidatus Saccharibacteria bacterium]|nr:hypothetical protein [Candidatus Saccharibacteria bacterium]